MDDLRSKISLAAQDLFLQDGIGAVSMRKVAERVGVTAPAIYRYFRDKEELLNEIIASGLGILQEYLKPALSAATPFQRLQLLTEAYLSFAMEQPKYFDFAFLVPGRQISRLSDEIQRHEWSTFQMALEQVSLCMEEGVFGKEDPEKLAILLWSTVHGLVILYRTQRIGTSEQEFRAIYRGAIGRLLDALRPGLPPGAEEQNG